MSQLQLFTFAEAFPLRTVTIDGEPWFIAADVCKALGLDNSRMAVSRLDDDEKGVSQIDTLGGQQQMAVINESGLYNLILRSDKPQAKPFKKWVTSEVLPSIRKKGSYALSTVPDDFESALRLAADQQREIKRLALQAEIDAPKVEFAEAVMTQAEEKSLSATAKHFGKPPQEFNRWLKKQGLIFKRAQYGGQKEFWEPMAHMSSGGYITLRQELGPDGRTYPQAKVSGKGLEYIQKMLSKKGYP